MVFTNLIDSGLLDDNVRITVQEVFQIVKGDAPSREELLQRSKTLGQAKSLLDFYDLVRQAIENYESRKGVLEENKIIYTEEDPKIDVRTETITYGLVSRKPGAFQRGAPGEANIRNLRPRLREEKEDPTNPGYRFAITGYWYDNVVRFTCWATTNKAANARAEWFEDLMEEYAWFFTMQGVNRVIFNGRGTDIVTNVGGQDWYGRPIDYFVRTEKLRVFSEKTIEEIIVKIMTKQE